MSTLLEKLHSRLDAWFERESKAMLEDGDPHEVVPSFEITLKHGQFGDELSAEVRDQSIVLIGGDVEGADAADAEDGETQG